MLSLISKYHQFKFKLRISFKKHNFHLNSFLLILNVFHVRMVQMLVQSCGVPHTKTSKLVFLCIALELYYVLLPIFFKIHHIGLNN